MSDSVAFSGHLPSLASDEMVSHMSSLWLAVMVVPPKTICPLQTVFVETLVWSGETVTIPTRMVPSFNL